MGTNYVCLHKKFSTSKISTNTILYLYNVKIQPGMEDKPDQASVEPYEQELHEKYQMQRVELQPQLDHIHLALTVFLSTKKNDVSYSVQITVIPTSQN